MRIGLVCPYSLDVPGGVQNHVRDLAEVLIDFGHEVSVLVPADDDTPVPDYVVPAGRAVPIPYNGSVARLSFGPLSAARVRRWLREGEFDVLHVHEPALPSLSLLTVWAAYGPIVGTFHSSMPRSRMMSAAATILRPAMEKVSARIAVSEAARTTLVQHLGGEPIVIPNGLFVDQFADAEPRSELRGDGETLVFLGRIDEARKGLSILLEAFPRILAARPGVQLLVAGRGDEQEALGRLPEHCHSAVRFLGMVDDATKAAMFASSDLYVAPHTGGESFGIVLVEAMAGGAPVLASDLAAFSQVLDGGTLGALFEVGDAAGLADRAIELLADPERRELLRSTASAAVRRYDWSTVAREILSVYEMVAGAMDTPDRVRVSEDADRTALPGER